jgi:hypothetical protein
MNFSTRVDCPWDTIRMVPTPSVAGHTTSLESQIDHNHAIFQNPSVVSEELRTFVGKEPITDPVVVNLFQKQNPQVPGMMGPK